MKRAFIALTACFLLVAFPSVPPYTAALGGQEQEVQVVTQEAAKLVVEGPTSEKAGNLVVISVEKSRAASFKWISNDLPTSNFLVIEGGKRAIFSSGTAGTYSFTIACALNDTCDVKVHTVTLTGGTQPADNLTSRITSWCDKVSTENKRDECLALAQSFASVALVMEGGTLTTPLDIVNATKKSTQEALASSYEAWEPFRYPLAEELSKMADSGELTDTESHIRVWKVIASALRDYASTL